MEDFFQILCASQDIQTLKVQISLFFKSGIQVSFEHVHFLAKNLSEFVSPSLKLHSQYWHIEGAFQIHIEFDDWGHYNA